MIKEDVTGLSLGDLPTLHCQLPKGKDGSQNNY